MNRLLPSATVVLLLCSTPVLAQLSQSGIEESLTCQCGCGLTVHTCNHLQCNSAIPIKEDIARSLAAGQSGEEILRRYARTFGEKILSSPTRTGFNLLAWIIPYLVLLFGAMGVGMLLRHQMASRGSQDEPMAGAPGDPPSEADSDMRRQLEDELRAGDR
ncbi:MAG: cytochrome c-type biogenesis protein CcmH [Candidatus Binatia bacterium]